MASSSRRSSFSSASGSTSALMKRSAVPVSGKAPLTSQTNKRAALGNLTNQSYCGRNLLTVAEKKGTNKVTSKSSALTVKNGSACSSRDTGLRCNPLSTLSIVKPANSNSVATSSAVKPVISNSLAKASTVKYAPTSASHIASKKDSFLLKNESCTEANASSPVASRINISPVCSTDSMSLDESMSMCDSVRSREFEYIDVDESSTMASLERRASTNFHISDTPVVDDGGIRRTDDEQEDPQLCETYACDIYDCLREAEMKKMPLIDYMERVQSDINPSMRSILVDWLVEVSEEYRLVPETLYLTVNYIDRYLSGNEMNRQRLQLLGVACMLIASKYEEICAPQVEEFCYITDNTYFKEEVVQMEADVLNYLKYEMSAPTIKCFLRRFVRVAQRCDNEVPLLHTEFVANYIAELSLLDYSMLCYPPSLIAASAIFLSRFILQPAKHPWNSILAHFTRYQPSHLCECAKALHHQVCNHPGNNLPAIREKYSQHKYKFAAKKHCPPSIPSEFFEDMCR